MNKSVNQLIQFLYKNTIKMNLKIGFFFKFPAPFRVYVIFAHSMVERAPISVSIKFKHDREISRFFVSKRTGAFGS